MQAGSLIQASIHEPRSTLPPSQALTLSDIESAYLLCCCQGIDEGTAIATVHEAFHQGINFFDVAPVYGSGRAEQVRSRVQGGKEEGSHW
jgi:predicted oxidoreductase